MCKLHLLISSGYKLHVPPTLCVFELIAERILCKPPWKQSIKLIKEQNNIYWYPQPTIQSSFYLFFFVKSFVDCIIYFNSILFLFSGDTTVITIPWRTWQWNTSLPVDTTPMRMPRCTSLPQCLCDSMTTPDHYEMWYPQIVPKSNVCSYGFTLKTW